MFPLTFLNTTVKILLQQTSCRLARFFPYFHFLQHPVATVEKLNNKSVSSPTAGIVKIVNQYHCRGFTVKICLIDNEFEVIRERNVFLNMFGPSEHILEIKRKMYNQRTGMKYPYNTSI
jgi:hypothetical protein